MNHVPRAPESWIDTFAVQELLDAQRSRDFLDITGSDTPSGLIELSPFERGVRVFRLPLQEGRTLALQTHGDDDGYPIVLLHGTPSGLEQLVPPPGELSRYGFRLVTYERPGYGDSDRKEGRTVADVADEVGIIAEIFGLKNFSVTGRSGGAAGALACAAILGKRQKEDHNIPKLNRVLGLGACVPPEAKEELDLFEGLGEANTADVRLSEAERIAEYTERARKLQVDPLHLLRDVISKDFRNDDYRIARFGMGAKIAVSHSRATREPYGYIDDELAASRPWGFELESIDIPVHLWAAAEDPFTPTTYTQWLAKRIPGAGVTINTTGASHLTAMDLMDFLHAAFGDIAEEHARSIGKHVLRQIPSSLFSK